MKNIVGDITTVERGIIVQQVNAQGKMNSGVAKAIREKYPHVWEVYSNRVVPTADQGLCYMGMVIPVRIHDELYVANLVGQQFYGNDGKKYTSYDALDMGFTDIARMTPPDFSVNVPLIGSGLGGGCWNVIKEIINFRLADHEVNLWTQQPLVEKPIDIPPQVREYFQREYGGIPDGLRQEPDGTLYIVEPPNDSFKL